MPSEGVPRNKAVYHEASFNRVHWIGVLPSRMHFGFVGQLRSASTNQQETITLEIDKPMFTHDVFDSPILGFSGIKRMSDLLLSEALLHDVYVAMVYGSELRVMYQRQAAVRYNSSYTQLREFWDVEVANRDMYRGSMVTECMKLVVHDDFEWHAFLTEGNEQWDKVKISLNQSSPEWKTRILTTMMTTLCPPIH